MIATALSRAWRTGVLPEAKYRDAALRAFADDNGPSADLARQMLFEAAAEGARRHRAVA